MPSEITPRGRARRVLSLFAPYTKYNQISGRHWAELERAIAAEFKNAREADRMKRRREAKK